VNSFIPQYQNWSIRLETTMLSGSRSQTIINVGTQGHIDHGRFDNSYLAVIQRFQQLLPWCNHDR
jgi:hypothetical protein